MAQLEYRLIFRVSPQDVESNKNAPGGEKKNYKKILKRNSVIENKKKKTKN